MVLMVKGMLTSTGIMYGEAVHEKAWEVFKANEAVLYDLQSYSLAFRLLRNCVKNMPELAAEAAKTCSPLAFLEDICLV